jgi:hypothetical protein
VQLVQVSSKGKETDTENPSKDSGSRRTSSKVVHGLAQLRNDVVDHVASTLVLVGGLDAALALDGFLVKSHANLGDFISVVVVSIVVVVVVSIVVVVVIVIVALGLAGQASGRSQWLGGERVSVVVLFVRSLWCVLGASGISEDSSVDTRRGTVGSGVVHLVVAVVVVVVVLSFFNGTTFAEFVKVHLITILLHTVGQSLFLKTRVQAILVIVLVVSIVVVVVVVSAVVVVLVVVTAVLAAVFAAFLGVLAFVFARFLQGFLVGLDEFSHLDNVFSTVAARTAAVVGAKLELDNHVASESFISLEHGDGSAAIEFESGISHPRIGIVVVVVFKLTGFSHELLSHLGVCSDGSIESSNWRGQSKEGERKAELHFCSLSIIEFN